MSLSEQRYSGSIGKRVGFGQCGSLTSDFFESQTGYNFADAVTNPAPRVPSAPANGFFDSAWNVYNQVDWNALGYERINNPSITDLRPDDTFYVTPARSGLWSGHTGLIASVSGGSITTLEQNVNGLKVVQRLPNANSWTWYGGFDGIVRKKAQSQQTGDIEMYLIQIVDTTGKFKGRWYVSDGVHCRYVRTPRMLANYKDQFGRLNLRVDRMFSSELFREFDGEKNIL